MKTLLSLLAVSFALTLYTQAQSTETLGTGIGSHATATMTAPTPRPVVSSPTAVVNGQSTATLPAGSVQSGQQVTTTLGTGSPTMNNSAGVNNNTSQNPAINPAINNQNAAFATNGFNGNVGFNNSFATNNLSANGTVDVGAIGAQLLTLQANVEQTLNALAALNARVINNNNGVGLGAAASANGRSLTASGSTANRTFPGASASGQFLPPTGSTTATTVPQGNPTPTGPATASASTSLGTDARTFELLVRLQNNLRQSDAILQNLNGSFSANGVNANGTLSGNQGNNIGFTERFTVSTNR